MSELPERYEEMVAEEGRIWSDNARRYTAQVPPDWRAMRREYNMRVVYRAEVERLMSRIQPGQRILDLGCNKGWLSLELARQGAEVDACDVAEGALEIARNYYEQRRQEEPISGSVRYFVADVNTWEFPTAAYDWVIARGVLHHLVRPRDVLLKIRQTLKPEGTLWVSDPLDPPRINAFIAGVLLLVLPTQLSYREKLKHLLRVRGQAVRRVQAAIETEGASPFEGIGRPMQPLDVVRELFTVTEYREKAAFAGFISAELKTPYRLGLGIMQVLWALDRLSVKLGLLHGLNYELYARPKGTAT